MKLDFVTILFNNDVEKDLLKIHAYSLKYIDIHIINKIYVLFNDNIEHKKTFKKLFEEDIINYYPCNLRDKINLLFLDDVGLDFKQSNWFTQQIVKIVVSKIIKSEYYVVIDTKNHFIENITIDYFFRNNKPYLYFNPNPDKLLEYYSNCLNYFNVKSRFNHRNNSFRVQTTTPFLFITSECLNLINHIEDKEKMTFDTFFITKSLFTEFFLYYAFLIYSKKDDLYDYEYNKMHPIIIIGNNNEYYNKWEYKQDVINKNKIYVFSLHRLCFFILDNQYKEKLIEFYKEKYNNEEIIMTHIQYLLSKYIKV
jgi:hypothetical protein